MCTLTWIEDASGYEVFFNRDERRTRSPAEPPSEHERNGVRFLAPIDGDKGGSWISVNEHGVCCCLLNFHHAHEQPSEGEREFISRGELILALADASTAQEAIARIDPDTVHDYRPFTLVCFGVGEPIEAARFDGRELQKRRLEPRDRPISSSSVTPDEVHAARRELFSALEPTRDSLLEFHRSHLPERGALSVCMHRPDAKSVSFCHVVVGNDKIDLDYSPESPCRAPHSSRSSLNRRTGDSNAHTA